MHSQRRLINRRHQCSSDIARKTTRTGCDRADRVTMALPGRLTWKDSRGMMRFASVVTRDISDTGVFIEWSEPTSIPLYRLVRFQLERDARQIDGIPSQLRNGKVLSAVYRSRHVPEIDRHPRRIRAAPSDRTSRADRKCQRIAFKPRRNSATIRPPLSPRPSLSSSAFPPISGVLVSPLDNTFVIAATIASCALALPGDRASARRPRSHRSGSQSLSP